MKKTTFILIFLLGILSCNNKKENRPIKTNDLEEKINTKKEKKYYLRIFVENLENNKRRETTAYISKKDTIYTQVKLFKNNELDTLNSYFYNFELYDIGNNTYSGKITLYSYLDKLNSPYTNTLTLSFLGVEKEFESKNQNFVEFKFKSKTDTLMGLLSEFRSIDTIIKGEKMIRFVETYIPIDTKEKTNNPYIEVFDITEIQFDKKNER